ncbi:2837_t:CDS:1, partial [Racocetra persica]
IKDHEVYSAVNNKEREQLHKDYHEVYSELKEVYGIRHNIQAKEERQNNPEIDMIKAPFLALERDKQRERMKSIKDFENKGGCDGKHILSYGSLGEHQAEMIMEEEMENLEEEKSEQKETEQSEKVKEILIEKK